MSDDEMDLMLMRAEAQGVAVAMRYCAHALTTHCRLGDSNPFKVPVDPPTIVSVWLAFADHIDGELATEFDGFEVRR